MFTPIGGQVFFINVLTWRGEHMELEALLFQFCAHFIGVSGITTCACVLYFETCYYHR